MCFPVTGPVTQPCRTPHHRDLYPFTPGAKETLGLLLFSDSCHNDEKNTNYTRLTVLLQAETSVSGASCPGLAGFADDVHTVRKCKLRQSLPTLHSPRAGNPKSIVPDLIPMGEDALI